VVFLHGFTQTGRSWMPVASELSKRHEVVLVDAPGHGGSAEVRAGLDDGAVLLGAAGGRATYVGYSMGARFCLHLALARPDLVERLVLVSGTAGIDDADERAARRTADEALATSIGRDGLDAFIDRWLAQPLFARLAERAGAASQLADHHDRRRNSVTGLASSLRLAGTGAQAPLWSRLAELTMPVMLVAGADDTKFVALARRMATAIGAHAHVCVVAGAGHAVHLERPEATIALLHDALDG
jgi:2-succinyl-6-hydroxy-2,4-cyclohexadiene-1-carboxylate synthase